MTHFAYGFGIGTRSSAGDWLEVYYPAPQLNPSPALVEALGKVLTLAGNAAVALEPGQTRQLAAALANAGQPAEADRVGAAIESDAPLVITLLASDAAPASVPEAYLKLHLLSHRLIAPNGCDLTGVFRVLPNVAWTSEGAIAIDELPARQTAARLAGRTLEVRSVDKFPKMSDYVVPDGVRIADATRVRLGAHLGPGTTVMHEGFCNFNAGTTGASMVEGRISAGVVLGEGTDLGGGASTMGTLSGGGEERIVTGEGCLVGANAGCGIPLGARCTIEAGLYVTAGTKVTLRDGGEPRVVKARELAGRSNLLFRRNSQSGAVEVIVGKGGIELNEELHAHN